MDCSLLGWPEDDPRIDLDHEQFAYAGNFRTGRTGIAVVRDASGDVVAAVSFDPDRAVDDALRVRYVTVREDRRGEGIGPTLLAFLVERALDRGFEVVRIGVNNPIAYRACYAAGFGFTGEQSGMGELVLEAPRPDDHSPANYREGLEQFAERDLPPAQERVLERHRGGDPPAPETS